MTAKNKTKPTENWIVYDRDADGNYRGPDGKVVDIDKVLREVARKAEAN